MVNKDNFGGGVLRAGGEKGLTWHKFSAEILGIKTTQIKISVGGLWKPAKLCIKGKFIEDVT